MTWKGFKTEGWCLLPALRLTSEAMLVPSNFLATEEEVWGPALLIGWLNSILSHWASVPISLSGAISVNHAGMQWAEEKAACGKHDGAFIKMVTVTDNACFNISLPFIFRHLFWNVKCKKSMTEGESWMRNMHTKQSLATSTCLFPQGVFRICNTIVLLAKSLCLAEKIYP